MERFSHRESVLLCYSPQRSLIKHPCSSPKSPYRDIDLDFNDVFGGPPRRSSIQEMRSSSGETTDSSALRSDDETISFNRRWSGLNEKPVFGEDGDRRRYTNPDFFDDIFRGHDSTTSSPRKHERDSFSPSPGSRLMSPARSLPPRGDPFGSSSLPAQFSLPTKLIKGTDLPTFGPNNRNHQKSKDGASNGIGNYSYSPLSRSSSQANHEDSRNGVYHQSALSLELSSNSQESSNSTKADEADKGSNLKRKSNMSDTSINGNHFHFSFYKWASKGVTLAMPLRGGNGSRLKEKCKLERCSSANGRKACEGVARESPTTTLHNNHCPLAMELDKQENGSLFSSRTQGRLEQCQIVEEAVLPKSESETSRIHQVVVADHVPGNSILQYSREGQEPHSVPDTGLSGKMEEEISAGGKESPKTELKQLRSLFFDNNYEQVVDETPRKIGLKESKVKSTKKASAVFNVNEDVKKQDGRTTLNDGKVDKANLQGSPADSRGNTGKNGVRGKVKEFVKIFNQEASNKPKVSVVSQGQNFRRKERSKIRIDDKVSVATTKTDEATHRNCTQHTFVMVDDSHKHSVKQHSKRKTNKYNSTDVIKDSLVSTAGYIPNGSEAIDGDTDESLQGNFLIEELPQVEDKQPQNGNNQEDTQVIDAKIRKWANGKEGNIRSLLSTLQYILWPESGWKPVPLVNIIEGNAVKRSYQKALLCLHPDKLQQKGATSHQKYIAEKVFEILQEAWTHFNLLGSV